MHERRSAIACCCGVVALSLSAAVSAQYAFTSPTAHEDRESIRYFGSSKDEKGSLLPDVTVELESEKSNFVFVTDELGRFRGHLPIDLTPDRVTAKCFRPGFQLVRVSVRPGPKAPTPTVQVDCILRSAK